MMLGCLRVLMAGCWDLMGNLKWQIIQSLGCLILRDRLSFGLPPVVGRHLIIAVRWCGDCFLSLQAQESVKLWWVSTYCNFFLFLLPSKQNKTTKGKLTLLFFINRSETSIRLGHRSFRTFTYNGLYSKTFWIFTHARPENPLFREKTLLFAKNSGVLLETELGYVVFWKQNWGT